MTTRPKRREDRTAAESPRKKRAGKKAAAKKKAASKTRGAKPARRRKTGAAPKRARAKPSAQAGGKIHQADRQAEAGRCAAQAGRRAAPARVARRLRAPPEGRAAARPGARARPACGRASPSPPCARRAFAGVAIKGAMGPRYAEVLTPAALRFLADLHREFEARARAAARGARRAAAALRRGRTAGFPSRHQSDPRRPGLARRADPARPAGPPRRDHRAGRPQDDRQCAQFRRQRLHGGFRGRQFADLGQQYRGPDQPEGPLGRQARLHRSGEPQALQARRQARGADRAPARLASGRGAPDGRRRADLRRAVRFRALFLPQRARRRSQPAPGPISTCRSSRRSRKRGCGTRCSCSRRSSSAFRTARSTRPC